MNKSIKVNAILNAIRQCIAILYGMFTIPYVSRILGSDGYGKINFSMSLVNYFILFAGLGISTYAVREGARLRDDYKALQRFINEIFSINIISSILSLAILFLLCINVKKLDSYGDIILILAIQIIFITLGTDWINVIFEDYLYTTIRIIIVYFVSFFILVAFVKRSEDYLMYAVVVASNKIISNIINMFYIRRRYVRPKITIHTHFKTHIIPLLVLFFNALTISIYVDSDKTMLSIFISDSITGIYSVAVNIYVVIKTLVNAMTGVALPRLSKYLGENDTKSYNTMLSKMFHALLMIVLPCSIGLFFLSEKIILILSGNGFISGATSLKILAISLIFGTLSYCVVYAVLIPHKMEGKCFVASITSAVVNVILNFILIPIFSLNGAAVTTLISEIVVVAMNFFFAKKIVNISFLFDGLKSLIFSNIVVVLICLLVDYYIANVCWCIGVSLVLCFIVYFLLLFLFKDKVAYPIMHNILRKYKKKKVV
mgnify:CR=1 FL=1